MAGLDSRAIRVGLVVGQVALVEVFVVVVRTHPVTVIPSVLSYHVSFA